MYGLLGFGLFFLLFARRGRGIKSGATKTIETRKSGWYAMSGVDMSSWGESVMNSIGKEFSGKDMIVTSCVRSAKSQAAAMLKKLQAYGEDSLYSTYSDDDQIRELLKTPNEQWAEVIQKNIDAGRPISKHVAGLAIDIDWDESGKYGGITMSEAEKICGIARSLGYDCIIEENHIHIESD